MSPNTVAAYRRDLSGYLEHLAIRGVPDPLTASEEDVASFGEFLADRGLAVSSRARSLAAVRTFHTFLAAESGSDVNPAIEVTPPKQIKKLPKAISVDDVTRLIDSVDTSTGVGLRDRAVLEILYGTGARISEAVSLTMDDVDLESGLVRLWGKGRKERIVPIGTYGIAALEAYIVRARPALAAKGRGVPEIFLNTLGRPLSRQSAWALIQSAAERAKLTGISPHTLRHSFATHLLNGGADVRVVQELLGHSSVTTTQIYTLITAQSLREVYVSSHPRARRGQ